MKMYVVTVNEIEGFHNYPDAPVQVAFLKHPHRHIFYIECKLNVSHDNREIEIFIQQDKIKEHLFKKYGKPCMFKQMSCEMIAIDIINAFPEIEECKVTEDGKGGAIVQR